MYRANSRRIRRTEQVHEQKAKKSLEYKCKRQTLEKKKETL